MTLRIRIVGALVLAALIPMAVVLAVPLAQAEKRAGEFTAKRLEAVRTQASKLVEFETLAVRAAADAAAGALAKDRDAIEASLARSEAEALAKAHVEALAVRFGLDRVEVVDGSGASLASFGTTEANAGSAILEARRRVPTDRETWTLVAARALGVQFVTEVTGITGGAAALQAQGSVACPEPRVEVAVVEGVSLCVSVERSEARDVRNDLLKSFARVAPAAFFAALAVGLVIASRIARPFRELADRAEAISAQHARPITLMEEKDETRRMTLAFDQMLDDLRASERRRLAAERVAAWEEIAKRLAHEIKNPLSPIQLAVENLRRTRQRSPTAFDEAFEVETRTILEEVGSLRGLVEEFAQFARLPRPTLAECNPGAIVHQALALFSGRIESLKVAVDVDDAGAPNAIRADAEQIGRVLKNAVANALDAMEESNERSLSVSVRAEGDRVVFAVRDTGRGFDPEALRRVFEPYFTTRTDRGGTGLGMAIARRIAIEHGGSLTAVGALGHGATITLTLPLAGPP